MKSIIIISEEKSINEIFMQEVTRMGASGEALRDKKELLRLVLL